MYERANSSQEGLLEDIQGASVENGVSKGEQAASHGVFTQGQFV